MAETPTNPMTVAPTQASGKLAKGIRLGRDKGQDRPAAGRAWGILGLIAFVLVDAVLIVWALAATGGSGQSVGAIPISSFLPSDVVTTEPTPDPEAPSAILIPDRQLLAIDAETAWRTVAAACPGGPAVIEGTEDGGRTWSAVEIESADSVVLLTALSSGGLGAILAAADTCAPEYRTTHTGGAYWSDAAGEVPSAPRVNPNDPERIILPTGSIDVPCAVDGPVLAAADGYEVHCVDGSVRSYAVDTAVWTAVELPEGAVATVHVGGTRIALVVGAVDCSAGYSVIAVDAAVTELVDPETPAPTDTPTPLVSTEDVVLACVPADTEAALALSVAVGGELWLWAGDTVLVSEDGGATWGGSR